MGRPVTIRAGVGASDPTGGGGMRLRAHQRAFRSPFGNLRFATRSNRVPHRAASPSPAPESARQAPPKGNCLRQSCCPLMQAGWLSSGQTIGAARTAVRSACCLPELRGANCLRRLCPLGTRFPTFPPCTPLRFASRGNRAPHRAASPSPAPKSAPQSPPGERKPAGSSTATQVPLPSSLSTDTTPP